MQKALIAMALVLVLGLGFLGWQMLQLGEQVSGVGQKVEEFGGRLDEVETRAAAAEERMIRAQEAAETAAERAGEARQQADAAATREEQSRQQAEAAALAKEDAVKRKQQAEARERREAEARQKAEKEAREAAEREAEAEAEAQSAKAEAERAKAEAEEIRRRLQRELDRLERSLGKIAKTRREALGVIMTLDGSQVEFDFNEAEVRPENREILSRIAGVLSTFENYGVQIFGHTDDVGSEEYNQELSERRAESVRKYLIEAGIDADAISTMGLGKDEPLVEGTDPESRQRNRRVELAIVFSDAEFASAIPDE